MTLRDPPDDATRRSARTSDAPWIVLLVDDEPDVHEITRLVLADTTFSGRPIDLRSAYSASEARAFLEQHRDTALMLLDVVMETDDAGLRLVHHVREEMGNADLQIVLRTGQPGMAPEREVIAAYDINGYFLKTELVAQKLRSIVISSLRTYGYIRTLHPAGGAPTAASTSAGQRRVALEEAFGQALDSDALHLLAQPQVHLASGAVAGVELIPNWRRGEALLGPAQMGEAVHDPELRQRFDAWLFGQGCAWAKAWRSLDLPPFRISLPILTDHDGDHRLLASIEQALAAAAVPQGVVDIEVPDSLLLVEGPKASDLVASMKAMGLSVTLVDFGLGLVSLPRLRRLLPDRVKIHHSFVRRVTEDRERAAIARSIIALVHTLELSVIADGLTSEHDLQFFKWEGCDIGQGDLLSPPMAVTDVSARLRNDTTPIDHPGRLH